MSWAEDRPCLECEAYDQVHGPHCPLHPDHDPTPWCHMCGLGEERCKCSYAENH